MKRFQKILVVPVTERAEAPPALTEAVTLAEASGAQVLMVGHLDEPPRTQQEAAGAAGGRLQQARCDALVARLASWTAGVGRPDLPIDVSIGAPPAEVAARVERDGHDLVVIADDAGADASAATLRIVRNCPCPVWLLRPGFTGRHVLAAIDPDHPADVNRLLLELARSQAELHGGDLHVVHAWELVGGEVVDETAEPPLSRRQLGELATAVESAHRSAFEAAVESVGIAVGPDTRMVDGPPARAIHWLADLYRADLLVIGGGAFDVPGVGLGSTAELVLARTSGSVLVVKPTSTTV